jgi:hypothetical protein
MRGRKYSAANLLGWCSGNQDNAETRYIQLGVSFFENENVKHLTASEFLLYLLMIKAAGPRREFELPRSAYKNYLAPATFDRAKDGLTKKGFIEVLYSGKATREASRYRFTFTWKETSEK